MGWDNLPIAINSCFSLYNPIDEIYGLKYDSVTKPKTVSLSPKYPDIPDPL